MIPDESEIRKDSELVLRIMEHAPRRKFSELQADSGLKEVRLCSALIHLLRRDHIRQEMCDDGIYYCINLQTISETSRR